MANRDNRNDNVEKLQQMKRNTQHNIEAAEEAIAHTNMSQEQKQEVRAKNQRREESIAAFEEEMQDEKQARQNGYRDQ